MGRVKEVANNARIANEQRPKLKPPQLDIARAVINKYGKDNLIFGQSHFYSWSGRLWEEVPELKIQREAIGIYEDLDLSEKATANTLNSVVKLMKSETFLPDLQFDGPDNFISCANGELLFNGERWALRPHVREHYRLSLTPVEYNPEAGCPRFLQFLDEIFINDPDKEEKIKAVQQFMGYSLTTSCTQELFILLIGEGANGKSVLLSIIEHLVGSKNVAAVDPTQFSNKFQRAYLRGKLVNIITELKQGLEIDDAALKSIVSGEMFTAEEKFRDPFNFRPYVKCWFATNHLPHTRDVSYAFFRRAILIEFNRKFDKDSGKDTNLRNKLLLELPGIFNFALAGLVSMYQEGCITEPSSSVAAKENWRMEADQIMQFVDECCKLGLGWCSNFGEFFKDYLKWAKESGITKSVGKGAFSRRLKSMGVKPTKGTNGVRLLQGIEIDYNKSK